jgi:hypothetical protein
MSSTTSTDSLQPWQLFTLAGLIGATVVVYMSRGQTPAGIILLSFTIFAAAVVGLAAWRTFVPLTRDDDASGPQILGGRTRAALEREKALVLRSIKELEFDRAMGKVSERKRAAGLIRQLDAGTGYREQIEQEIAKRSGSGAPDASARRSDPRVAGSGSGTTDTNTCASCNTTNDPDARFCKHCGAGLERTA